MYYLEGLLESIFKKGVGVGSEVLRLIFEGLFLYHDKMGVARLFS